MNVERVFFEKRGLASLGSHAIVAIAEKHMGVWLRGRALPSHGRGHKFKSCNAHHDMNGAGEQSSALLFIQVMRVTILPAEYYRR